MFATETIGRIVQRTTITWKDRHRIYLSPRRVVLLGINITTHRHTLSTQGSIAHARFDLDHLINKRTEDNQSGLRPDQTPKPNITPRSYSLRILIALTMMIKAKEAINTNAGTAS